MLSKKVPLLEEEIQNYKEIQTVWQHKDSVQNRMITDLSIQVNNLNNTVVKQKKNIKIKNWGITGCIVVICLLIL